MIDYHCHILPGIDDGPTSIDDSMAMAEQLSAAGFAEVYCTPHCIRGVYENSPKAVRQRVAELQEALDWYRVPLTLRPGMEYYIDEFFVDFLIDLQPLGDTGMVLVEAPPQARLEQIADGVLELTTRGYVPLIAHPERLSALAPLSDGTVLSRWLKKFSARPDTVEAASPLRLLQEIGCRFQGNVGSFVGYYGADVRARAVQLLAAGQYDCFGSDGHAPEAMASYLEIGLKVVRGMATCSEPILGAAEVNLEEAAPEFEPHASNLGGDAEGGTPCANRLAGQKAENTSADTSLLCVYGEPGSGKAALLRRLESLLADEGVLHTEAEAIVWDIPFSVEERTAFEQKYVLVENLLVNDLHALADTPAMAKEFCRLVRDRQNSGRLTVVASDLSEQEWAVTNALLAEVLAGGESIRLTSPA